MSSAQTDDEVKEADREEETPAVQNGESSVEGLSSETSADSEASQKKQDKTSDKTDPAEKPKMEESATSDTDARAKGTDTDKETAQSKSSEKKTGGDGTETESEVKKRVMSDSDTDFTMEKTTASESETEGRSTSQLSSQEEGARTRSNFEILPERKAKVQTYLNLIEKGRGKDKKKDDKRDVTTTDEEVIYCLCRSSDCSTFMIACDICEEWYHGSCVGVEESESGKIKRYACPPCREKDESNVTIYKEKKAPRRESIVEKERRKMMKKEKKKEKLKKEKLKKMMAMKSMRGESSSEGERGLSKRNMRRCGECEACLRSDCGKCDFCLDMKKFGGKGKLRQKCRTRQCLKFGNKAYKGVSSGSKPSRSSVSMSEDSESDMVHEPEVIVLPPKVEKIEIVQPQVDIRLRDHFDYAMRPEMDPRIAEQEKKERKEERKKAKLQQKALNEQKKADKVKAKAKAREEREFIRQQLKRRTSSYTHESYETPHKRKQTLKPRPILEKEEQCYGPGCTSSQRASSKYCSDECGMKLATNRLFEFLPQRIQQWQSSPCIAEENNRRQLERTRKEMEEARKKIADLDQKIVELNNLIIKSKKVTIDSKQKDSDDSEEPELSIHCVTCGHQVNPSKAMAHMNKCFRKYESQTSFGSAFKTRIVGESMFCDFFNSQQNTYCKRLKVLCPEHTKEPRILVTEVCGCPLVSGVFQESGGYCRAPKRHCNKHYKWEQLRRAEIDLERVRWWLKLDELLERERMIRSAMSGRSGVLALMLHQTIDHSLIQQVPTKGKKITRK